MIHSKRARVKLLVKLWVNILACMAHLSSIFGAIDGIHEWGIAADGLNSHNWPKNALG